MNRLNWVWLASPLLFACSETVRQDSSLQPTKPQPATEQFEASTDYHSFSNPDQIKVTHLDLDLTADFERSVLHGQATLSFERIDHSAKSLIVDTRDLKIASVTVDGTEVEYSLKPADPELGAALQIMLPKTASQVTIDYQTSPSASGVQWLTPEQTAGKQHPFLFTQAQAVHARSFIPLQDSPQVRMTYDATIHTPEELLAVMSASNDPDTARDGEYHFTMPQPIPSYLIALAIGNLDFKAMGKRTLLSLVW